MTTGVAAIWVRVSTRDQRELSPDSQEAAVRRALETQDYCVPDWAVVKADWSSLDLMACPQFQQLREWIISGAVQAVGVLDRDRLQAQGLQRLVFLSECQEHGVQVITAQGVPMLEGAEGQLVELALALGKERAVMRAQQGARDGLRDRAVLHGLPAVPAAPFGYLWDKNNPRLLRKAAGWEAVSMAWRLALEGTTLRQIAYALTSAGFRTAKGHSTWYPSSVGYILANPVYAGRYYSLRYEAKVPRERRGVTYGKSSRSIRPGADGTSWEARSANWVRLNDVVVEDPPVSWDEFLMIQERLVRNKELALANVTAKRFYLLGSLIICQACGARYYGKNTTKNFVYYMCGRRRKRVKGGPTCDNRHLPAAQADRVVWEAVSSFLSDPETVLKRLRGHEARTAETEQHLMNELDKLTRRWSHLDTEEADLVSASLRKDDDGTPLFSSAAIKRNQALIKAQRTWITEERQRIEAHLASLKGEMVIADDLRRLQERVQGKLVGASPQDKRWVLEMLHTRVLCWPDRLVVEIGIGAQLGDTVSKMPCMSGAATRTRCSWASQVTL